MTPERWRQIKAVYNQVDAAASPERPALLDDLCAGDTGLREEVEKLLRPDDADALLRDVVRDAAARMTGSPDLTGRTIGPYRMGRLIAPGGMGEVYAAEDTRLGREVAIKLLPTLHEQDAGRVSRFQKEARAVSALNHPNILTVFDFGRADGVYYIATELVQGETVRHLLTQERLPLLKVIAIAVQIADALSAAHQAGVIHRDIKPDNLMLRRDGYVKVLDFGLAKSGLTKSGPGEEDPTLTADGLVMGTTRYMSPEQARGLPLDARSDIFSLGVVLYEMLCGHAPFQGESSADVITAILRQQPTPLPATIVQAAPGLESVIIRCLRKDPEQRYASSKELHLALQQIKQGLEATEFSGARLEQAPAVG